LTIYTVLLYNNKKEVVFMKKQKPDFMSKCFFGSEKAKNIDKYILKWKKEDTNKKLYEYLGMTLQEFIDYESGEKTVIEIVKERLR
jgi:hypothetical protein